MIRPSLLPIAEKCGLAPVLAETDPRGSGTHARVGTAYHTIAAKPNSMDEVVDKLTDDERDVLHNLRWPVDIPEGATRERKLGLSPLGRYQEPGTPGALTEGTPDVFWMADPDGLPTVRVVDYKTGQLPVEDGPLSLQLVAYGFAAADLLKCDAMQLGIWYARYESWDWSEVVQLDSPQAADLWRRVVAAATAEPKAQPGPHCESCWQRAICPARLLPAIDGSAHETLALAPFVEGGGELDAPRAEVGLRLISAMREVADRAEEHIRAEVLAGRLYMERDGKVYGPSEVAGRRSASVEELTKAGLTQYVKQGKPYMRWSWKRP